MEKGFEKLLRKLVFKKYPMYLDVYVSPYVEGSLRYDNPFNKERYEVFLVINVKDYNYDKSREVGQYVSSIGNYMNVEVMEVYNKIVDDEEWENMNK